MVTPNHEFEKSLLPPDCRFLLGIDEVGRGPLAGPVTIGAYLLDLQNFDPQEFINLGIRDSKLLPPQKRQKIHDHFHQNNHNFKTFSASSDEIDRQGIAISIYSLISKAIKHYGYDFDFCLIDGKPIKQLIDRSNDFFEAFNVPRTLTSEKKSLPGRIKFVVKGDQKCFSIAAASIVAKVDRDSQMDIIDTKYPKYGFASHKGYGTKSHLEAIINNGPCPIHRYSYQPIKKYASRLSS